MQHASSRQESFELLYGFVPRKPVCQRLRHPTAAAADLLPSQAKLQLCLGKKERKKVQELQEKYAAQQRSPAKFEAGHKVWLKSNNLPCARESKALSERSRGQFTIFRLVGKNAALLDLPASVLVHPVFSVSLLSQSPEEPPQLRRASPTQVPVAQGEYVIDAILAHRINRSKSTLEYKAKWLDGTYTREPEQRLANAQESIRRYF